MGLFADKAEVKIDVVSGVLRVRVRPRPTALSLVVNAIIIVVFGAASLASWQHTAWLMRACETLVLAGSVFAWFQKLSGFEEEIEIGEHRIRINREVFGWHKVSEFPIEKCSDLDLQTDSKDSRQLQFRFGRWRTIEFGYSMSKEQAEQVIDALADSLPDVARRLLPSLDITKAWTTLNLN